MFVAVACSRLSEGLQARLLPSQHVSRPRRCLFVCVPYTRIPLSLTAGVVSQHMSCFASLLLVKRVGTASHHTCCLSAVIKQQSKDSPWLCRSVRDPADNPARSVVVVVVVVCCQLLRSLLCCESSSPALPLLLAKPQRESSICRQQP